MPYYYRTDADLRHIGPFGNEVKSEERPMVQRWIVDQLRHWVEGLGVDGFRIDLAGQIDEQTLLRVKRELPPDLIIYGEPWIAPSDPDLRANFDWAWYKVDAPITFFQDDARNAAMRDYWRGLLALRRSEYGRVFRVAEVPEGHYRWITPEEETLLGYVVGGRVLVLANSSRQQGVFRFDLPEGDWRQVGDRERVDLNGVDGEYTQLRGGGQEVRVPAGTFLIWVLAR